MSESMHAGPGSITWMDLTVENADEVRDFYSAVVGWKPDAVPMGGYDDYSMNEPGDGRAVAGICHARGANAELPPQWLIYITVADIEESVRQCLAHGGETLGDIRTMGGYGHMCVIRDPVGAVAALFQSA